MAESLDVPEKLYKYLPCKYVEQVLQEGALLFRNLTYYRQSEDQTRGDESEGIHIDHPNNPITIKALNRSISVTGDFSFHNSIDQDKVFVFCLSTVLEDKLFDEFKAECCIVIENVQEFLFRCRRKILRSGALNKSGFLHRKVDYYRPSEVAQRSVKDPKNLPFFKDIRFIGQCEYRLVYGMKGTFKLRQSIVDNKIFNFQAQIQSGQPSQRVVRVGSLEDIARVIDKHNIIG